MIKLSSTSKLGAPSWSLQALETCPGSIGADGALVPACSGCYATTGNYRFANVRAPRIYNREDWQRAGWVDDMVDALQNHRFFRWFDSGDMYSLGLAEKIREVMARTPWVSHWLPTRMQKFRKFHGVISLMRALPNVSVRFSSDGINGEHEEEHGSTIVPSAENAPGFVCRAYDNGGKCGTCRACWDKTIPLISYVAHGKKMGKQYRVISIKKG